MDNILRIFTTVAEAEDLKIGTLEKSIGASKGVLSRAINNGTDVQSKWLMALIEKYPEYDYSVMLKGEFSTVNAHNKAEEIQEEYGIKDLNKVHQDIKNDLRELSAGLTKNFEVLSEGMFESLKGQQKILDFIDKLDANKIAKATGNLEEFLKSK